MHLQFSFAEKLIHMNTRMYRKACSILSVLKLIILMLNKKPLVYHIQCIFEVFVKSLLFVLKEQNESNGQDWLSLSGKVCALLLSQSNKHPHKICNGHLLLK